MLKGIHSHVKLRRAYDRVLRRYENSQFNSLPERRTVPGRAAAAWYKDGELRLNFYAPDLELEILGQTHQAPAGARLEIMDGKQVVLSLPVTTTGNFTGRIPLSLFAA